MEWQGSSQRKNLILSIITINFNNGVGLSETIKSVISQSYKNFEYIVIDGGSTDKSVDIIRQNADKISFWISESDAGVYNAMNKGIAKATGKYVLFLNSGDTFYSNSVIEKAYQYLPGVDVAFGDLIVDKGSFQYLKEYPSQLKFNHFFTGSLGHPSSFIRRELFSEIGSYNEENEIVSDWEFFLKALIIHKYSYKHLDFPISVFNTLGISSKAENIEQVKLERIRVLRNYFPAFIEDYEEYNQLMIELKLIKESRLFKTKEFVKRLLLKKIK